MYKNKTILVTGAGGYIGRFVVKYLLNLGVQVSAVDYNTEFIDERAKKFEFNIFADYDNIYEELGKPDVCLHLAWRDGFVHNSESHLQNLYSHYKFIRSMVDGGLQHVAVMGTMHEIGYFEGEINEDTPTNPHSLYGIAKNSLRQSLSLLLQDKAVVFQWLRAFYIYGDDAKSKSVFSKIIQAEEEGKEVFPFTTGENKYDFITIEELAEQISLAAMQTKVKGIINCCSGIPISLKDKVEEFLKINNFSIRLEYGAFPERAYDSPGIWGDSKKIEDILSDYKQ
ncbi:nucleoside-diphosphate-sugar epimerase family protein [Paenibacillus sp. FSL R7-277]|uniref:NAD-dependent epimerase/dehydratase family protein n=1 Tax=Paenibacillus sp. FSL R7-277 TaxID=1227352 RepID=UPI0003E213F6|nr:NAD(P)-dependent oxidoreductase [Paenibacillus sp. FSL R7-277]ETT80019.1 nucleoside-diphosphate-sugar epimerase family protein [Paenibacillus sp. FSL R7-277]